MNQYSIDLCNLEQTICRNVDQYVQSELKKYRQTVDHEIQIRDHYIFELENKVKMLECTNQISENFIEKLEDAYKEVVYRLNDRIAEYQDVQSQIRRISNQVNSILDCTLDRLEKSSKDDTSFCPKQFDIISSPTNIDRTIERTTCAHVKNLEHDEVLNDPNYKGFDGNLHPQSYFSDDTLNNSRDSVCELTDEIIHSYYKQFYGDV
jgi:arginine utilization protein RocB